MPGAVSAVVYLGEIRRVRRCERSNGLRQAEVEHFDRSAGGQLDIGRFQIAMHDPALVRGLECLGNLARNRQRLVDRNRSVADPIRERRAIDQFHHDRPIFKFVDLGDVRMIQHREQLCLAGEARQCSRIARERIRQHFDRDVAIEPGVLRAIDLPRASRAEEGLNLVTTEAGAVFDWHGNSRLYASLSVGPDRFDSAAGRRVGDRALRCGRLAFSTKHYLPRPRCSKQPGSQAAVMMGSPRCLPPTSSMPIRITRSTWSWIAWRRAIASSPS